MGYEDIRIRDISRISGEWAPPVGALGGPPAHELYRDLVTYAGLQLFQDIRGHPWVLLRDGAQRRAFPVPSVELRSALDRFRMRRNSRPLPKSDLAEFVRIVEARISDPDVKIPVLRSPVAEGGSPAGRHPPPPAQEGPATSPGAPSDSPLDPAPKEPAAPRPADGPTPLASPGPEGVDATGPLSVGRRLNPSISGGRLLSSHDTAEVARYVRTLRRLVRDGDWMGTTRELSQETRDDPLTLYGSLLRYRSELADNGLLFASVDVVEGFRWVVMDRTKLRTSVDTPLSRQGKPALRVLPGSAAGTGNAPGPAMDAKPVASSPLPAS